jgi:hypothetical protein
VKPAHVAHVLDVVPKAEPVVAVAAEAAPGQAPEPAPDEGEE